MNAFIPGFEKTFADGVLSFELRMPTAETLSRNVYLDGTTNYRGQLGDIGMAFKGILEQCDDYLVSIGVAMTVPSAPETNVYSDRTTNNLVMQVHDDSFHVMPFVGYLWTPDPCLFAIGYMQVDFDVNGNEVYADPSEKGAALKDYGRYRLPTVMYLDGAIGYWLHGVTGPCGMMTALAPVFEVHYNQSLERSHLLTASDGRGDVLTLGGDKNNNARCYSIIDLTIGLHAKFCDDTIVTVGYCLPATSDREFDSQFRCFVNRRF